MGARARLLMTMTGFDTVIISRAVPASALLTIRERLQHISHISTNRRCDGALATGA